MHQSASYELRVHRTNARRTSARLNGLLLVVTYITLFFFLGYGTRKLKQKLALIFRRFYKHAFTIALLITFHSFLSEIKTKTFAFFVLLWCAIEVSTPNRPQPIDTNISHSGFLGHVVESNWWYYTRSSG